jgi:ADP-heptose:LPS heptosyltransferase
MPDLSPVSRGMDCPLPDIKALNGASFVVGVHPGAGSSIRQWPVEHFARLADLFVEQDNAHVAIFGGGGEAALASAMHDLMKHRDKATNLAGRLDLKGFMSALAGLRLFIGNISGPAHMAGALKVPTLTIFSGQVVPHEWNPLGEASLSVRVALDCAPCYKAHPEQCPHNLKCLKMLLPGRVHGAAMEVATLSSRLKEAMPSQQRGSGI